MPKNNKKSFYTSSVIFILIFFIFFIITSSQAKPVTKIETVKSSASQKENTEKIILLLGEETVNFSVTPNTTFHNALLYLKNNGKISFSGKNYPGLGFFVTDIGSLHAGNGKNLLYYINGKEASVGVSSYTLKDGDIIEWKLK